MQKAWFCHRRRTMVRQRAKARLKSHIKWRNPPTKSADFNLFKVKNLKIKTVFNLIYYRDFCSALNEPAPLMFTGRIVLLCISDLKISVGNAMIKLIILCPPILIFYPYNVVIQIFVWIFLAKFFAFTIMTRFCIVFVVAYIANHSLHLMQLYLNL